MLLKLAWRNIWRNHRRSFITIASILFAVFFAVIARSFQLGAYDQMISSMVENNAGYIQLHKKGYWDDQTIENSFEEKPFTVKNIKAIQDIEAVVPRLEGFALCAYQDMTKPVRINGIDPEREDILSGLKEKVIAGKYITGSSTQALVTEGLASYFELAVGDTIYVLGQGYHATNAVGRYTVGGIIEFAHPLLNEGAVYLSLKEAQWFFNAPNLLTTYVIDINDPGKVESIQQQIIQKVDTAALEVMNWKEMMPELIQAIQADSAGGILMIFILYMVITFGIFGTILMMTAERKKEFGVLISIGMKRWRLSLVMISEIIMLAFTGVLAGLLLAAPVVYYLHIDPVQLSGKAAEAIKAYGFEPVMPTSIDPSIALTHGILILIIALVLAIYPVHYVLRLKTVEAMRG